MTTVLTPGDELMIIRDCAGHDTEHIAVLLEKGDRVKLIGVERVLVQIGHVTLSVDAKDMFTKPVILSVNAENLGWPPAD